MYIYSKTCKNAMHKYIFMFIFFRKPFSLFQVMRRLFEMFATMGVISFVAFVMSIIFGSEPPTPPGRAEANVVDRRKNEKETDILQTIKEYKISIKELFSSKEFPIIWIVFPLVSSIFRCTIVLLSSILRAEFSDRNDVDKHVGIALAIAWVMYTIGSFATGPILSKTHRYKEVTYLSVLLTFASCLIILLGVHFGNSVNIRWCNFERIFNRSVFDLTSGTYC